MTSCTLCKIPQMNIFRDDYSMTEVMIFNACLTADYLRRLFVKLFSVSHDHRAENRLCSVLMTYSNKKRCLLYCVRWKMWFIIQLMVSIMTYHNEMALALSSNGCDYTRITYTVNFLRGCNRVKWHLLDRLSSNGCDEANLCITVYFLRGYGQTFGFETSRKLLELVQSRQKTRLVCFCAGCTTSYEQDPI